MQDRIHAEIAEKWQKHSNNDSHTLDITNFLADIPLVEYAFNESLRLYPPGYVIDKVAVKDVTLGDHFITKGSIVSVHILGLHRNPEVWENPDTFDIDRWSPERLKKIPEDTLRFSFLPFSHGSRDCIGKYFAIKEAKLLIAMIMKDYSFELPANFKVESEGNLTIKPTKLPLLFKKRK